MRLGATSKPPRLEARDIDLIGSGPGQCLPSEGVVKGLWLVLVHLTGEGDSEHPREAEVPMMLQTPRREGPEILAPWIWQRPRLQECARGPALDLIRATGGVAV